MIVQYFVFLHESEKQNSHYLKIICKKFKKMIALEVLEKENKTEEHNKKNDSELSF